MTIEQLWYRSYVDGEPPLCRRLSRLPMGQQFDLAIDVSSESLEVVMDNFKEQRNAERKRVASMLKSCGYIASVKHGRGTAANWLDVVIFDKYFTEREYRTVLGLVENASGRTFRAADCINIEFSRPVPAESSHVS